MRSRVNMKIDLFERPDRQRQRRQACIPERHLAEQRRHQENAGAMPDQEMFKSRYADVFKGPAEWQKIGVAAEGETYGWEDNSTYVKNPPYFSGMQAKPA
jgi:aconitase A